MKEIALILCLAATIIVASTLRECASTDTLRLKADEFARTSGGKIVVCTERRQVRLKCSMKLGERIYPVECSGTGCVLDVGAAPGPN